MATEDMLTNYYNLILRLTKEAGKLVLEGFHGIQEVTLKGGKKYDIVTDYDVRVEKHLIGGIKEQFPDHLFIGEESAASGTSKLELTDTPTWIIDPIDGTTNFAHRMPLSCISVALSVNKEIVIGIIYNPMMDHLYTAIKGKGAFMNGNKIETSSVKRVEDAVIISEPSLGRNPIHQQKVLGRFEAITKRASGVRAFGCAALSLCYVAQGSMDAFFIDGLQCWDFAAGACILIEAGGHVSHTNGGPFDVMSKTIIGASTEDLAKEIASVINTI